MGNYWVNIKLLNERLKSNNLSYLINTELLNKYQVIEWNIVVE